MQQLRAAQRLGAFGDLLHPHDAEEPILSRPVRGALMEWLTETWAAGELEEVGLRPRRKALFHGAPGTGKTTLAHHLAARLGLPLLLVRPDRIVEKWLGATGQNLGALFDAARPVEQGGAGPVVLFFDEFEAIASERKAGAQNAQREMTAVLDTPLQRFDAHDGIVIAATNLKEELDPAIWRRFDLHVEIGTPGPEEVARILARYLAPFRLESAPLSDLAAACAGASPALLRALCEGIKRSLVLGPKVGWDGGREAVMARVLAAIAPHPSLDRPRLWTLGSKDPAVKALPWPPAREGGGGVSPAAPDPGVVVRELPRHLRTAAAAYPFIHLALTPPVALRLARVIDMGHGREARAATAEARAAARMAAIDAERAAGSQRGGLAAPAEPRTAPRKLAPPRNIGREVVIVVVVLAGLLTTLRAVIGW